MKKNIFYSVCLALVLGGTLASCSLDVTPTSDIGDKTFWKTQKDAWYGLNACYANMPTSGTALYLENFTDNSHSHKPWEGPFELVQQSAVSSADLNGYYNYDQIRRATNFIVNVDQCDMPEALKNRMKAEAKVFRAIEYMGLVEKFGSVPLITELMDYDAPNVPRSPVEEVQAFVLKDLKEAAEVLPQKYSGGYMNEAGRLTRSAALTLLGRAALSYGNYALAEEASTTVIREGQHSLFKIAYDHLNSAQLEEAKEMEQYIDFDALHIDRKKFIAGMFSYEGLWQGSNTGVTNPEYIMTHEYMSSSNPDATDYVRYQYLRPSQLVKGYSSFEPMQSLVDAYWQADGKTLPTPITMEARDAAYRKIFKGMSSSEMDQQKYIKEVAKMDLKSFDYTKEFRNRDSRLYASILFPFKGWHETDFGKFYFRWDPNWVHKNGNESWTGYSWRKQVAIHPYDTGWGENYAYSNYPLIRYAEVLLIAAEAHLYNTGWDAKAQGYVNQLRERCGMPDVPTDLNKEQAIEFLRNERRIELAGEGQRFNDLRRYGSDYYQKHMSGASYSIHGDLVIQMAFKPAVMLMPIPQDALQNNSELKQNPGY